MKTYEATFEKGWTVYTAEFKAENLKEAKGYAQFYKRHNLSREFKTSVRLSK